MNADLSKAYTYTDFQGFTDLRRMARQESPEAADAAARQFEALFIQMMMKSMRDATPVDGGMDGEQVKFFQGMFDQQIALEMSRGEGIGLRESMMR
ncbi:MAG TPA: rod-binding protein, partial [Thioalkalivibrio sp.]|nr:rod-binding protein [Thioalkalivibrio sp.]